MRVVTQQQWSSQPMCWVTTRSSGEAVVDLPVSASNPTYAFIARDGEKCRMAQTLKEKRNGHGFSRIKT